MTINSDAGKALKHFAQDAENRKRYVILALENPDSKGFTEVVDLDSLDGDMRAELDLVIRSYEVQRAINPKNVLSTKFFIAYPNNSMYDVLTRTKKVLQVPSDRVMIQCPNETIASAADIIKQIENYNAAKESKSLTKEKITKEFVTREEYDALLEKINFISEHVTALISKDKKETKGK